MLESAKVIKRRVFPFNICGNKLPPPKMQWPIHKLNYFVPLLVQKNHDSLSMIHGTWQHFIDHGMIMESFPWLLMGQKNCHVKTFRSVSTKFRFHKKFGIYNRTMGCLFTKVISLKKKLHSTRLRSKSVLLRYPSGQDYTF